MDFQIALQDNQADMTFTQGDTILNNLWISLAVERGTWWFNPAFGMRPVNRMKNTEKTVRLVKGYVEEALQWLLDNARASAIVVTVWQDIEQTTGRLTVLVEATQADGRLVTYETFISVV